MGSQGACGELDLIVHKVFSTLFTSSSHSQIAFVSFNPGNNIGIARPRLISVSVPEQGSLRILTCALLVLVVLGITRPNGLPRNPTQEL